MRKNSFYVVVDPATGQYLTSGGDNLDASARFAGTWTTVSAAKAAITRFKNNLRYPYLKAYRHLRQADMLILEGEMEFVGKPVESYAGSHHVTTSTP